jgi:hypothetical protein
MVDEMHTAIMTAGPTCYRMAGTSGPELREAVGAKCTSLALLVLVALSSSTEA